jgi:single-stranded-DNA-specific exonuclease
MRLSAELRISPLLSRVLAARGYTDPLAAYQFLNSSLDGLVDPFLLLGARQAAARLAAAVRNSEPILLYGDYDVDGTTSIVLLEKVLSLVGAKVDFHVPHRLKDGYGMRPEVIQAAAEGGVRLIVSVDTGIRANAVVAYARELGIDVIVTDHHLPEAELPPALAVLNPNQPNCPYPEKNLCGAGVAFKLAQALMIEMGFSEARRQKLVESLLKMVAIATVADVVPLVGENRVIVKHGLAGLTSTSNPGLQALLEAAGFERGAAPNAQQVAFRVAPRINAAGRMDTARDVVRMFLTSDVSEARRIAAHLHSLNQDRQQTEAGMLAEALEQCEAKPVDLSQRGLVFSGAGWHKGVVGIVASRLVERFCRPVFVLAVDEAAGEAAGSGRSVARFHLLDALESMADLFIKFGGHKQAAGVTLKAERVDEFRERFNAYAAERLEESDLCKTVEIDAVARIEEIGPQTTAEWRWLAPFGCGNPAPLIGVQGAVIPEAPAVMKEKHLKFRVQQERRWIVCKGWNWAERMSQLPCGKALDLAVSLEEDTYGGGSGLSAVLKDVGSGAIENRGVLGSLVEPNGI